MAALVSLDDAGCISVRGVAQHTTRDLTNLNSLRLHVSTCCSVRVVVSTRPATQHQGLVHHRGGEADSPPTLCYPRICPGDWKVRQGSCQAHVWQLEMVGALCYIYPGQYLLLSLPRIRTVDPSTYSTETVARLRPVLPST